jgi:hypothetical protein
MLEIKDIRLNKIVWRKTDLIKNFFSYPCAITRVTEDNFSLFSFRSFEIEGPFNLHNRKDSKPEENIRRYLSLYSGKEAKKFMNEETRKLKEIVWKVEMELTEARRNLQASLESKEKAEKKYKI